jgi:hypothetical protein
MPENGSDKETQIIEATKAHSFRFRGGNSLIKRDLSLKNFLFQNIMHFSVQSYTTVLTIHIFRYLYPKGTTFFIINEISIKII